MPGLTRVWLTSILHEGSLPARSIRRSYFHGPNQYPDVTDRPVYSRDAAGFHFPESCSFRSFQQDSTVQVGAGNTSSLANAEVIRLDHGARSDSRRRVFRA